jgi:hypothetical protein
MSENSSTGDSPIAALAPTPVTVAKPTPKADSKSQDWQRARIVIAGLLVLAAIGFVLAMVPTYPSPSSTTNEMLGGKLNTGKVISYTGPDRECRQQQAFDNETGQMTKPSPCDLITLDSSAAPASSNPSSRLDAISKAFSGR